MTTEMNSRWYKVVSRLPVPINFENGHSTVFSRGKIFEANPMLKDIRRLLRLRPPRITEVQRPQSGGIPMPTQPTHMPEDTPSPVSTKNLPPGVHEVVKSWER